MHIQSIGMIGFQAESLMHIGVEKSSSLSEITSEAAQRVAFADVFGEVSRMISDNIMPSSDGFLENMKSPQQLQEGFLEELMTIRNDNPVSPEEEDVEDEIMSIDSDTNVLSFFNIQKHDDSKAINGSNTESQETRINEVALKAIPRVVDEGILRPTISDESTWLTKGHDVIPSEAGIQPPSLQNLSSNELIRRQGTIQGLNSRLQGTDEMLMSDSLTKGHDVNPSEAGIQPPSLQNLSSNELIRGQGTIQGLNFRLQGTDEMFKSDSLTNRGNDIKHSLFSQDKQIMNQEMISDFLFTPEFSIKDEVIRTSDSWTGQVENASRSEIKGLDSGKGSIIVEGGLADILKDSETASFNKVGSNNQPAVEVSQEDILRVIKSGVETVIMNEMKVKDMALDFSLKKEVPVIKASLENNLESNIPESRLKEKVNIDSKNIDSSRTMPQGFSSNIHHGSNKINLDGQMPLYHAAKTHEVSDHQGMVVSKSDLSSIHVSLKTEGIGDLDIELILEKGVINGHINASDPTGKEVMERNLYRIVETLSRDGLNIGGFSVSLRDKGGDVKGEWREKGLRSAGQLVKKESLDASYGSRMINIFV